MRSLGCRDLEFDKSGYSGLADKKASKRPKPAAPILGK
jgi:hypothetical protein